MSLLATFFSWCAAKLLTSFRAIFHPAQTLNQVEEEFQFHIDAYAQDLMQQGFSQAEAQRKARLGLGHLSKQGEKYRAAIGLQPLDEIGGDIRYGLRSLFRNPAFSAVAILSLALGIGATTAMFSLIYAVLIHPFPYADSNRIMNPRLVNEERPQELRWFAMTKPQFELFSRAKSIESLLGFRNVNMEITGNELPEDVSAIYVTENADSFFGVRAMLGRGIQPSDAQPSAQPIVVLNYKFWQRHFSGDPAVIGRTLQLEHANYTIAGVMPRSFAFNDTLGVGDVYLPRSLLHDSVNPPIHWPYTPWIKIKASVTTAQANEELGAIVHQFAKEFPARFPNQFHMQLEPIIVPYQQSTGHTFILLLAGVVLLLLIGCANCSVLLLARGQARQHELAVRSAIGASRWRIIRQLLIESLVIAFTGAALGVAASYWLAKLPLQLSPTSFPAESVIRINIPILTFSITLALLSGIFFGLAPALRLSRPNLAHAMQSSLRRIAGKPGKRSFNTLIVGQIALTLLLMATAGMAIGAFLHLNQLPLGYNPDHVMQAGIVMHWNNPHDWQAIDSREKRTAFIDEIRQSIAAIPGVTSVAVGTDATPPYSGSEGTFEISGSPSGHEQQGRLHFVSPEFFTTLRISLLQGRIWDATENTRGDFIAIVNESFAHRFLEGKDPVGHQLRFPSRKPISPLEAMSPHADSWREIIGVVADVPNDGLDRPALPAIYLPYTASMPPFAQFQIRTQPEPLSLLQSIRAAVQSVSSDQQISNGSFDLHEAIERDAQYSRQRLFSILFGFFSALALILSLVGLFSVVSFSVAQRTTEFGVRMALGAPRSHILWIAAQTALQSVTLGVAIGISTDLLIDKLLSTWMNTSPASVTQASSAASNLTGVTLILILCAISACLLPARRAASIPPTEALRYE
jgi:predicted permease